MIQRVKERHESKVMVSAGISYYGVTRLIFIVGTVEQNCYIDILTHFQKELDMLSSQQTNLLYFQQDGASCHRSDKTMMKINEIFSEKFLPVKWPAKSPDLSPIEFLWGIVTKELYKRDYETIDELKFALEDLWNRIPIELCRDLIGNFDKRIDLVKKYNGMRFSDS